MPYLKRTWAVPSVAIIAVMNDVSFQDFLRRHAELDPVGEDNDAMRNSYILLDERLCVLDSSSGSKVTRASVLLDGVDEALSQAGFEQDQFLARGGVYQWDRRTAGRGSSCGASHVRSSNITALHCSNQVVWNKSEPVTLLSAPPF